MRKLVSDRSACYFEIYDNKKEALAAAKRFQQENGGRISDDDARAELHDEDVGMATFGAIIVVTAEGDDPILGNAFEEFYYELDPRPCKQKVG